MDAEAEKDIIESNKVVNELFNASLNVKSQTYSLSENEFEDEKKQSYGDVYDLYGMASKVHSKISDMTRDYTLAKYNTEIINNQFAKFVREQKKIVRIIESELIRPLAHYINWAKIHKCELSPEEIKFKVDNDFHVIRSVLLGELDDMVVMSRGAKGEITTGILMHGRGTEEREEFNRGLQQPTNVSGKLMEKEMKR